MRIRIYNLMLRAIAKQAIFYGLFVTMLACQTSNEKSAIQDLTQDFPKVIEVEGISLAIESQISFCYNLHLWDSLLFVSDPDTAFHFKVFDLKRNILIKRLGSIGGGVCEVQFPTALQLNFAEGKLGLFDRRNFKYNEIPMEDLTKEGDTRCYTYPHRFDINYSILAKYDNKSFVGFGVFEQHYAVTKFMEDSVSLSTHLSYPLSKFFPDVATSQVGMASQANISVHQDGERFVVASKFTPNIDFLSIGENGVERKNNYQYSIPEFDFGDGNTLQAKPSVGNLFGFVSLATSTKHVYALYSGKSFSSYQKVERQGDTIFVYVWEGNPIHRILLDKEVQQIAVDQEDRFLIGFVDDGESHLYKYQL